MLGSSERVLVDPDSGPDHADTKRDAFRGVMPPVRRARGSITPRRSGSRCSLSRRQCWRRYGRSRWPRRAMAVASDDCASGGLTFSVDPVDCDVLAPALSSACAQNFGRIASTLECHHIISIILPSERSGTMHDAFGRRPWK